MGTLYIFAAVGCAFVAFAGLFIVAHRPALGAALLLGGTGGFLLFYTLDRRREKQDDLERAADIAVRAPRIADEVWTRGKAFEVRGTGVILHLALVVAIAATGIAMGIAGEGWLHGWVWMAAGILFALVAVAMLWILLPRIWRPAISVSREGFATVATGLLAWREIEGVYLQAIRHNDRIVSHTLTLSVPGYARLLTRAHPLEQLLYRIRGAEQRMQVTVQLSSDPTGAQLTEQIVRKVWTLATGKDYQWVPGMSGEATAALARSSAGMKDLDRLVKRNEPASVEDLKRRLDAIASDSDIVASDANRRMQTLGRQMKWITWITMAGVVMYVVLSLML